MQITTYTIPTFMLSALINGDCSNLCEADQEALESFIRHEKEDGHRFEALSEKPESMSFRRYHDMTNHGILACMCVEVTFDTSPIKEMNDGA